MLKWAKTWSLFLVGFWVISYGAMEFRYEPKTLTYTASKTLFNPFDLTLEMRGILQGSPDADTWMYTVHFEEPYLVSRAVVKDRPTFEFREMDEDPRNVKIEYDVPIGAGNWFTITESRGFFGSYFTSIEVHVHSKNDLNHRQQSISI